jgi:murein DD-endopeptidase MepM/ murein hydrolase activator NlpD
VRESSVPVHGRFGRSQFVPTAAARLGRVQLLAAALAAAAAVLMMAWMPAAAGAALVTASNGRLGSFSGGVSLVNGTLSAIASKYGTDTRVFAVNSPASSGNAAVDEQGTSASAVAQGSFKVRWKRGQTVSYGAAFYLPRDFHTATQGQQALIRWDSSTGSGGTVIQGGVVVDYGTNKGYLVSTRVTPQATTQRTLAGPFRLPIGRWFKLQIRQLLGSTSTAYSEVYENGKLVGSSRAPNFSGRQVSHLRYGIVQLYGAATQGTIEFEFDQATATAHTGYVNPLGGDRYITGRTDMGVDFCLNPGEPIRAVGDGVVVGISPNWFEGEPYVWYQLIDGPYAGRYAYVAEQIRVLPRIGTQVSAGQPIAYYTRSGTCIEMGWGSSSWRTLAQATTGYYEGERTPAGVSFARFLISLGVRGPFEL